MALFAFGTAGSHPWPPDLCSWIPTNTTSGEMCQMTNAGDLPEGFLLVGAAAAAARVTSIAASGDTRLPPQWSLN